MRPWPLGHGIGATSAPQPIHTRQVAAFREGYPRRAIPGAATGACTEAVFPDCKASKTRSAASAVAAAERTHLGDEQCARTTAVVSLAAAQNGTYACGWRPSDKCEAHDRSVAVRPGALATGSVVQSRSLFSRSSCSVLARLQPDRGLRRRSSWLCREALGVVANRAAVQPARLG